MAEDKMMAHRCLGCKNVIYPAVARCPECKGRKFQVEPMGEEAKVLTYTHLNALPEGFDVHTITLGIVEFPDGARATGQIEGTPVNMGSMVKPFWGRLRRIGAFDQYGWKFQIIE